MKLLIKAFLKTLVLLIYIITASAAFLLIVACFLSYPKTTVTVVLFIFLFSLIYLDLKNKKGGYKQ
jgi:hypothetical protein